MIRHVNLEEYVMLVARWLGSEYVSVRVLVEVFGVNVKVWRVGSDWSVKSEWLYWR